MKYIMEYQMFLESSNTHELSAYIESALKSLLPYTANMKDGIKASTHLDKKGLPVVRIDSKDKPTSIWLKVDETETEISIKVKTIVNSKENDLKGYGTKLFDSAVDALSEISKKAGKVPVIYIDDDQSHGYWKSNERKYKIEFRYT